MEPAITIRCPSCRTKYSLKPEAAGRKTQCVKCGMKFRIPRPKLTLEDQIVEWLTEPEEEMPRRTKTVLPPVRRPNRLEPPKPEDSDVGAPTIRPLGEELKHSA